MSATCATLDTGIVVVCTKPWPWTVTWTEPAVKGDTSGKVLKPAKISTGFEIGVPIFVAQGDRVEIDTRTGEYVSRAKQ